MSTYEEIRRSIQAAATRYPNCKIANCDCHSKTSLHWEKGCMCMCHFSQMDTRFGMNKWHLSDVSVQSKKGHPRIAAAELPMPKGKE